MGGGTDLMVNRTAELDGFGRVAHLKRVMERLSMHVSQPTLGPDWLRYLGGYHGNYRAASRATMESGS